MQGEGLSFLVLGVPSNMSSVPKPCWYRLAPGHLVLLLLAVEGFLWLSEHFRWFAFNQHKGWTVLIAVAIVGAVILLMIIWFLLSLILRLRFQYTIRSLLALAVVVAIPCGWLTAEVKEAREQRAVVEAIERIGGQVGYSSDPRSVTGAGLPKRPARERSVCERDGGLCYRPRIRRCLVATA